MPTSIETYIHESSEHKPMSPQNAEKFGQAFEQLSPDERMFAQRAVDRLMSVAHRLGATLELFPIAKDVEDAVLRWLADKAHGVGHSFAVFQREVEFRDAELARQNDVFDVPNEDLELRAVLHDIGEFLPVYDQQNEKIDNQDWQFRRHAQIISLLVLKIGRLLKVDDARQLAMDVRHHDFYWKRPTPKMATRMQESLSPAGQLLADADRLVGENVQDAIVRNRSVSLGKWYFLRELTGEERAQWRVRTGGIFDGVSAVLTEFSGQDHWFYTQTAREINRQKQTDFRQGLVDFYVQQYRGSWQRLRQALTNGETIEIGVKADKGSNPAGVTLLTEKAILIQPNMTDEQLREVFNELLQTPVAGQKNSQFPDREFYGYSLRTNGQDWLDPSILRFANEEELTNALDEAIAEYSAVFAEQKIKQGTTT
jgi:hypothetical protein